MPRALPLPADERRAAIIAATEPLLEAHGRNVSTRQIAEAAGIAEGTIFRVFPSKDALIDAVVEDAFDPASTCAELAAIDDDADLESRLVAAVEVLQHRLRRVVALFHTFQLRPPSGPDFRERQMRDNQLITNALTALVRPDQALLRMPADEAATLIRNLTFAVSHPMLSHRPAGPGDLKPRQIVDIFLYGVADPAAPNPSPRSLENHPC